MRNLKIGETVTARKASSAGEQLFLETIAPFEKKLKAFKAKSKEEAIKAIKKAFKGEDPKELRLSLDAVRAMYR